jgi:hypothetical protein
MDSASVASRSQGCVQLVMRICVEHLMGGCGCDFDLGLRRQCCGGWRRIRHRWRQGLQLCHNFSKSSYLFKSRVSNPYLQHALNLLPVVDELSGLATIALLVLVALRPIVLSATDEKDIFLLRCLRQLFPLWRPKIPW